MQKPLLLLIRAYKICFSPLLALLGLGGCRFSPTCSEYAFLSIKKYGSLRGLVLTLKRIIRCQPFDNL